MDLPKLTFEEARVFGCLIEKSLATPEYYPLTLNAVMIACNQKSSRDPVVEFDDGTVEEALEGLREKGLVAFASGTGRALKYIHRAGQNGLGLNASQAAALSVIMLRGPQTAAEIRARAGRQHDFQDVEAVQRTLESMMSGERVFLEPAPRRAGQKEERFRHRFFEYDDSTEEHVMVLSSAAIKDELGQLQARVTMLEQERDELSARLQAVEQALEELKKDLY